MHFQCSVCLFREGWGERDGGRLLLIGISHPVILLIIIILILISICICGRRKSFACFARGEDMRWGRERKGNPPPNLINCLHHHHRRRCERGRKVISFIDSKLCETNELRYLRNGTSDYRNKKNGDYPPKPGKDLKAIATYKTYVFSVFPRYPIF